MRTTLNIKERPYGLLLITATALFLAFVFPPLLTMDFKDKEMFTLPLAMVLWIIPLLLISFWCLYLLTSKFLYSMTITRIHVLVTVSATSFIMTVLYIGVSPSRFAIDRPELIGNAMQLLILIFLCGQFLYLANVLLGFFGRHKVQ